MEEHTHRGEIYCGVRDSLPLGVALAAVGIAFGYAAHSAGLTWWLAGLMSLAAYGSPAQFLALGLMDSAAAIPIIILAVFVANLRYSLFAASLAPHLRDCPRRRLYFLAYGLADGPYALTLQHKAANPSLLRLDRYLLGSLIVPIAVWVPSSIAGTMIGGALPVTVAFGLGFATPAIFMTFLILAVRDAIGVAVMLCAGVGSVAAHDYLPTGAGTVTAMVAASVIGGTLTWRRRQS